MPAMPRGDVFRMEINNGATQTVRYYGTDLTPREATTLRELEQLENEISYARNLQALKTQYIAEERTLAIQRAQTQQQVYANVAYGWPLRGSLVATSVPFLDGRFFRTGLVGLDFPLLGGFIGGNGFVGNGFLGRSLLASAVLDDGPIQNAVASTVARQATPEYMASLDRAYDRVAMQASASPSLRVAFKMPSVEEARRERGAVRQAAGEEDDAPASSAVMLTLKDGEKVAGSKMRETKDWIIIQKMGGGEARYRPSEVVRIEVNDKSKVRFAAD
jgi:hypothetical protein